MCPGPENKDSAVRMSGPGAGDVAAPHLVYFRKNDSIVSLDVVPTWEGVGFWLPNTQLLPVVAPAPKRQVAQGDCSRDDEKQFKQHFHYTTFALLSLSPNCTDFKYRPVAPASQQCGRR